MAADYEHNRNQEHASGMYCKIMPFLFLCAWCGLTHMGTAIRAIPHDNAYHNKPRVMQRVFETSYFTPIEKSNQNKNACENYFANKFAWSSCQRGGLHPMVSTLPKTMERRLLQFRSANLPGRLCTACLLPEQKHQT